MKKRLLALLLCLVMVIGLVPTVLAEGNDPATSEKAYYVNFNVHGGDPIDKIRAQQGGSIDAPVPTRYGYTFDDWYTNDQYTNKYSFNPLPAPGKDGENSWAHAKWIADTYTIAFDANGGSGSMASIIVEVMGSAKLTKNTFTNDGYTFKGWSTSKNGVVRYADEEEVSIATAEKNKTITLYAVWEKAGQEEPETKFTLTYVDYTGTYTYTPAAAASYTVEDYPAGWTIPAGKEFDCWEYRTEKTAASIAVGTTLYLKKDTVLYPTFKDKTTTYDVSYYDYYDGNSIKTFNKDTTIYVDPNGGVVTYTKKGSTAVELSQKTAVTVNANITLSSYYNYNYYYGYSFAGWKYNSTTNTFTAQWTKDYPNYSTYSIYYYDYDDCKSEYANFPYGTSIVIDPNGGTAKLSGTSFSTKQSFNIYRDYTLTDASRSGYTFYGWDLTKSGSTYYFTAMWSRYKSDVPYMLNGTDHYAYIKGYPNGSFKPTDTITRAEAATIFYRLLTDSTRKAYATTYNSFKDVPATAWYNTAVSTMAKLGIVNGGADGCFRPNDPITRAEIAAMIARCDGAYYTGTSTVFSDTYGHWAASYIARAYELGWINGYGTTYAPDRYISRAETVAVLNRVLNRAPQYTSDLTRNYTTFSDVATSAWYYLDVEEAANSHTYTRKSNADYETWTKLIADPSWF